MQIKISVILTVYNTKGYLDHCIETILCQSYTDFELIIVDDGSTDGSAAICDTYQAKDQRIKVIHKMKGGAPSARKMGMKYVTGEVISIVDSDDWLEPDMLEKLYNALTLYDADVSMCGRYEETITQSKSVCHGISSGFYDEEALMMDVYPNMISNGEFFQFGIFPSLWDKLFKREKIEPFINAVDDSIPMGNDAAAVFPALLNVKSIVILNECLYHYRQYEGSTSKSRMFSDKEKRGIKCLYNSLNSYFALNNKKYDFARQWDEYFSFLMMPRLYSLFDDMEDNDCMFPFVDVKKGSKVAIYGMGVYGKAVYTFLKNSAFCDLVIAVDRNYSRFAQVTYEVHSPEELAENEFDYILITVTYYQQTISIVNYLIEKGYKNKIALINRDKLIELLKHTNIDVT